MNKYDNYTIKIKDNNRNFIYILCIYERVLSPSIPNKDMFFVEVWLLLGGVAVEFAGFC